VLNGIVARIFHSLQKMRERIWLTIQYLATNVIGNIILVKLLATVGLALSSTMAINLHLFISILWIKYFRIGLNPGQYLKTIGLAYGMGAIALGIFSLVKAEATLGAFWGSGNIIESIVLGTAKGLLVMAIYFGQLAIFKFISQRKLGNS